jgi:hypothetical protein
MMSRDPRETAVLGGVLECVTLANPGTVLPSLQQPRRSLTGTYFESCDSAVAQAVL